jgi:hypothetical protein
VDAADAADAFDCMLVLSDPVCVCVSRCERCVCVFVCVCVCQRARVFCFRTMTTSGPQGATTKPPKPEPKLYTN